MTQGGARFLLQVSNSRLQIKLQIVLRSQELFPCLLCLCTTSPVVVVVVSWLSQIYGFVLTFFSNFALSLFLFFRSTEVNISGSLESSQLLTYGKVTISLRCHSSTIQQKTLDPRIIGNGKHATAQTKILTTSTEIVLFGGGANIMSMSMSTHIATKGSAATKDITVTGGPLVFLWEAT